MKVKSCRLNMVFFYGGNSVEHEVSIESAKNVLALFKKKSEIKVYPIYIDKTGRWYLTENDLSKVKKISGIKYDFTKKVFVTDKGSFKADIGFSMIHGNVGEDGKIQGFFETVGMAYAGCDVLSSALSMNKKLSKTIAKINGVPVLDDVTFTKDYFEKNKDAVIKKIIRLGFPVFVKPVSLGSSVGVSKVKTDKELLKAIKNAFRYDYEIMVEKGIDRAREIVCGIIGNDEVVDVSVCGEVVVKGKHEFYDYNAKYLDDNGMELKIPAGIKKSLEKKIQNYTRIIFKAFGCYGFARVDFLMEPKNDKVYFCEINTIPGFTSHSLFPSLFKNSGMELKEQIRRIVALAFIRRDRYIESGLCGKNSICNMFPYKR